MSLQQNAVYWLPLELAHCPTFILERLGQDEVEKRLNQSIATNIQRLNDDEFGKQGYKHCQIPNTQPDDYKYRLLETPLGTAITSIRFIGGDLSKPAVFLIHKDFELDTAEKIKQTAQFIAQEYAVFKPQRIRWYSPQIDYHLIAKNDFIQGDLVFIAEFIDWLKQQPFPPNYDQVQLKPAQSIQEWYPQYKASYEGLYKENPNFKEMASLESKETLQYLVDKNLLYEIWIENTWAGIIGVDKDSELFMEGYLVYEELLIDKFRGKKLGAATQRKMLEQLPITGQEMLFGTIHYKNTPSIKTALKVGRKTVGMYIFAEIEK